MRRYTDTFKRWPMLSANAKLYPTHTCFDDPFHFIMAIPESLLFEIRDQLTIVHALCRGTDGRLFAHGWIEGEAKLFFTIHAGVSEPIIWQRALCTIEQHERSVWYCIVAEPFYRHVEKRTRYTLPLAAELSRIHNSYGPWRGEYKPHCGSDRTLQAIPHQRIVGVFEQMKDIVVEHVEHSLLDEAADAALGRRPR